MSYVCRVWILRCATFLRLDWIGLLKSDYSCSTTQKSKLGSIQWPLQFQGWIDPMNCSAWLKGGISHAVSLASRGAMVWRQGPTLPRAELLEVPLERPDCYQSSPKRREPSCYQLGPWRGQLRERVRESLRAWESWDVVAPSAPTLYIRVVLGGAQRQGEWNSSYTQSAT